MIVSIDEADDPDNFAYVIPKEGAALWTDNMAIPVGSSAPCTAHAFIDSEILDDETVYPAPELRERLEIIRDTGDFEINFED